MSAEPGQMNALLLRLKKARSLDELQTRKEMTDILNNPAVKKFAPILCKVYSILADNYFSTKPYDYNLWAEYNLRCFSPRLSRYYTEKMAGIFFAQMAQVGTMYIEYPSNEESPFVIIGGFSEKTCIVNSEISLDIKIISLFPEKLTMGNAGVILEYTSANENGELLPAKEETVLLFKDAILLYNEVRNLTKTIKVEAPKRKIELKYFYLRYLEMIIKFPIQKFLKHKSVEILPVSEGCSASIEHPPFAITGVPCPIRLIMKTGNQENCIFRYTVQGSKISTVSVGPNQTAERTINIEKSEDGEYRKQVSWTLQIGVMQMPLPATEIAVTFLAPFRTQTTILDNTNRPHGKTHLYQPGERLTVCTTFFSVLETDVEVTAVRVSEGAADLVPIRMPIVLRRGDAFTVVAFVLAGARASLAVEFAPARYFSGRALFTFPIPPTRVMADPPLEVSASFPESGAQGSVVTVAINLRARRKVRARVEVALADAARGRPNFLVGGVTPQEVELEEGGEDSVELAFMPLGAGRLRFPEVSVSALAAAGDARTLVWRAAPEVFIWFYNLSA